MKRLLIIILCLLLIGCGKLTEGEICDKEVHPAYTWVQMTPVMTGSGSIIYLPINRYAPEAWVIYITDGENNSAYYVTEEIYEKCEIGMRVRIEGDSIELIEAKEI